MRDITVEVPVAVRTAVVVAVEVGVPVAEVVVASAAAAEAGLEGNQSLFDGHRRYDLKLSHRGDLHKALVTTG